MLGIRHTPEFKKKYLIYFSAFQEPHLYRRLWPPKKTPLVGMLGATSPTPISSPRPSPQLQRTASPSLRSTSGWSRMCHILRIRGTATLQPDGRYCELIISFLFFMFNSDILRYLREIISVRRFNRQTR